MRIHAAYRAMAVMAMLVALGVSGAVAGFSVKPMKERLSIGNQTLLLSCVVDDNVSKAFTYHWEKDGKKLKDEDHSSLTNVTEFRIDKPTADNSGIYTCVVKFAKEVKSANITVSAAPKITKHKKHYESRSEGEEAILKCSCTGYPPAEWKWYKLVDNKYELVDFNMSQLNMYANGTDTHLTFKNTEKVRDSGNYSCKAMNDQGDASESIMLRVHRRMDAVIVFLIIVAEVVILIVIIFTYEKYSKKRQLNLHEDEPKPLKEGIDSQNKDDGVHQRNLSQDL